MSLRNLQLLLTNKHTMWKMKSLIRFLVTVQISGTFLNTVAQGQTSPDKLKFVRQGVQRMIFDQDQSIPMAKLDPGKIAGLPGNGQ